MTPSAGVAAPSAWHLERAMSIAQQALAAASDAQSDPTDANALLELVAQAGVDVRDLVLRLCLSADEDENFAEACKKREAEVAARRNRFERDKEAKREAVLGILQALPELFPGGKFKHALASASVRLGKPGIIITDEAALGDQYVRVIRQPDRAAIRADLEQGVVIDGVEQTNAKPILTIKVT
jgi:hypothetical protein